jgi:hypothetical protein
MKCFSFIALCFYLSSQCPAVLPSAACNWLDLPEQVQGQAVLAVSSAAPVKHLVSPDDHSKMIVQLHLSGTAVVTEHLWLLFPSELYTGAGLHFFARAPPVFS